MNRRIVGQRRSGKGRSRRVPEPVGRRSRQRRVIRIRRRFRPCRGNDFRRRGFERGNRVYGFERRTPRGEFRFGR